jgi:hypothetical protein
MVTEGQSLRHSLTEGRTSVEGDARSIRQEEVEQGADYTLDYIVLASCFGQNPRDEVFHFEVPAAHDFFVQPRF